MNRKQPLKGNGSSNNSNCKTTNRPCCFVKYICSY